ncbi:MAG: glutamine--tRNA ligase/YqeY domain fusion protein [Candidatus Hodarchaeales archaeon]
MVSEEELVNNEKSLDFIRKIIVEDLKSNKNEGRVHTRFPPEPNGWLHIGHAKAIHLNYSISKEFNGLFNLRFDDTDPEKESIEYVEAIKKDIRWLGADWDDRLFFASDYFEQLYEFAVELIKAGKAYVCDLSADEIKNQRGTLTEPGIESPYRNRSIKENLELFKRMKSGEFEDGSRVLRAKIDMKSPNVLMRDPVMYRIKHAPHYRRGEEWVIYPTYDWTHGQSDAIECITHSLCSLEFENHRPLYNWYIDQLMELGLLKCRPRQIEFSRLNITYTVMSKRKLIQLVERNFVNGWDDPRMPTIAGMRRRGYPPSAVRRFLDRVGITKRENYIDVGLLESVVREELDKECPRVMAVIDPLKIIIDNYPPDKEEEFEVPNHPKDPLKGKRKIPFSRELYIEKSDFMENPSKKFRRLSPGTEVRLRYAYYVTCKSVVKDDQTGEVSEVHCTYDPETKGGSSPDSRKVRGTLHWVSIRHALKAEVRLYDRLFVKENPSDDENFLVNVNPDSLKIVKGFIEPSLASGVPGARYQFERLGYFNIDPIDSTPEKLVFNRTITLRDTWSKLAKKPKRKKK